MALNGEKIWWNISKLREIKFVNPKMKTHLKGSYVQKTKKILYYMFLTNRTAEGTNFSTQNKNEKAGGPFQRVLS